MDEAFRITVITADENLGRLFLEKIRRGIPQIHTEISLFGEAKPAMLYLERYLPAVIFLARQLPGVKILEIKKHIELFCPHALLVWLDPELEGFRPETETGELILGIPVLEWDKVLIAIEDEIPTELKFRFGMSRRENQIMKKIRIHAGSLISEHQTVYPTLSFIPESFVSVRPFSDMDKSSSLADQIRVEETRNFEKINPTTKQEWFLLLITLSLAVIFHLPWSERGQWELLRYLFDFLAAVTLLGMMLRLVVYSGTEAKR